MVRVQLSRFIATDFFVLLFEAAEDGKSIAPETLKNELDRLTRTINSVKQTNPEIKSFQAALIHTHLELIKIQKGYELDKKISSDVDALIQMLEEQIDDAENEIAAQRSKRLSFDE